MTITPGSLEIMMEMMLAPEDYELSFDKFQDCFVKSESITPKDILHEKYCLRIERNVPKIAVYVLLDRVYGMAICDPTTEKGDLGYYLEVLN